MKELLHTEALILGSGIAGATAAIELADRGIDVTVVTRTDDAGESNSKYAQGGIIYAHAAEDSPDKLAGDILTAGAGFSDPEAVRIVSQEGAREVERVLIDKAGVAFDTAHGTDDIALTREGGHGMRRIAHVADKTGKAIEHKLIEALASRPNVTLVTGMTAIDLLTPSHHSDDPLSRYRPITCSGAYLLDQNSGQVVRAIADHTILATGGLGQIYRYTTNPEGARGDGIAMAERAGARLMNLEFVQFHPTAFVHRDAPRFLITEAVRGEGGRLVNSNGIPFMERYDARGDLATRDIVARGIYNEMLLAGAESMYLDLASHIPREKILEHFPTIYETLLPYGVDITKDPIPVSPAAHYSCGGVWTDMHGRTTIGRLYAVGEVACTGLHGANRLASTSLLEGVVFGVRTANDIAAHTDTGHRVDPDAIRPWVPGEGDSADPALIAQDMDVIRSTMWNYVGLVRKAPLLARAIRDLTHLEREIDRFYQDAMLSDELIGLRNASLTGLLVAKAAWENRVSAGSHYRT